MGGCSKFNPAGPGPGNHPPEPGKLNPFEQNRKLGRGVNLGNALEAPFEGAWGVILEDWFFDRIKEGGFNSVRIPIRWSAHASATAPYNIDEMFLERVEWAVQQALSRNLLAIINMHHYEEIMQSPAAHKARFLGMWEQVARYFRNYPGELIFELLNEPNGALTPEIWNAYLDEAIQTIRKTNPGRTIMVGPGHWYDIEALQALQLPEDDRNIIVSFHYYSPFQFTHQGAEWVPGSDPWLGTSWNGTATEEQAIVDDLTHAANWSTANNRPLFLGEFGAIYKADMASRARWTAFVALTAESLGFSWSYWDFCANFAVFDKSTMDWHHPILDALQPVSNLLTVVR
ncbi:glycoside hydrolase family 5 protein [candidate division KSB1 bacterium]|nr:glycoside hydrolase family 5 protein [candidate division KSB1 bacterium]NIR73173.1 glycoside hydrolase family 5 protein [candidate division KSB1 bacterium]NIS26943.1 glycoside hydrolase family 5 protein [candidate division KSB1 bacterium]NIT73781.1 glycoside hydrolase family 5 protein [candidate division KSB1 bacterium]NIU27687.1 glycoside hydrolase family 5 protein [candidate division KSB1 bacterium]